MMGDSTELIPAQAVELLPEKRIQLGDLCLAGPRDVVERASEIAGELSKIIDKKRLFKDIKGKKFVFCEGWTTAGAMLGITPREVSTTENPECPGEFIATVVAVRMSDGAILGQASASCGGDQKDREWTGRSRAACRSMAQTRATSKVFRLMLSWVMNLAGYETTPAEEIDPHDVQPVEHSNPAHDERAPKAATRGNRVVESDLLALKEQWKSLRVKQKLPVTQEAWEQFVEGETGMARSDALKVSAWSMKDLEKCRNGLQMQAGFYDAPPAAKSEVLFGDDGGSSYDR